MTAKIKTTEPMVSLPRETLHTLHAICVKEGYDLNCVVASAGSILATPIAQSSAAGDPDFKSDENALYVFSKLMAHKLAKSATKGRSGWQECSQEHLSRMLREHVEKGDPVDVANFCMMLCANGDGIARQPAVGGEPRTFSAKEIDFDNGFVECVLAADHRAHVAPLLAEIERLKGIQPEVPPRPPEGSGLPRYGLRWNGPQQPLAVPMADGYWTPWHLAVQVGGRHG